VKPKKKTIGLLIYFGILVLPIYWMFNMSLRANADILASFALYPKDITFANYLKILTDSSWYMGYVNSIIYVGINTVISLSVALPAAYAFSRYRFLGDGQIFFWLLTNRMAPAAVFALPFFQLYTTIGLLDTHIAVALAHCLFNVPLAVWILEGFMSGIPKEIDETAFIDGYRLPRFFITIFIPLIRAGVGVTAFFCFMFSWVELLFARTLTVTAAKPIAAIMTRTISATGLDYGIFTTIFLMLCGMLVWELVSPTIERRGFLIIPTTRGTRFFLGLLGSAFIHLAWIGLTDLTLWIALPISAVWIIIVMRWG